MKRYIATFRSSWDEEYIMSCDGISDTHANARAWIKFMKTQWFMDAPDSWELIELKQPEPKIC